MGEIKFTASQAASFMETDGKVLRKFLRNSAMGVGQGGRYEFTQAELEKLKPAFQEWIAGKTKKSSGGSTTPRVPSARSSRAKVVEKESPLDADSLIVRSRESITARKRRHGLICNYERRTKTGTVVEICNAETEKDTRFCTEHRQLTYCGEPEDAKCGPEFGVPYCKYHNGDISEEEFENWMAEQAAE